MANHRPITPDQRARAWLDRLLAAGEGNTAKAKAKPARKPRVKAN